MQSNEHFEYMIKKRDESVKTWDLLMQLNGLFKDLEIIKKEHQRIRDL